MHLASGQKQYTNILTMLMTGESSQNLTFIYPGHVQCQRQHSTCMHVSFKNSLRPFPVYQHWMNVDRPRSHTVSDYLRRLQAIP